MTQKVQLFSYPDCVGSQRAKQYFQESGIPFEEINLSSSPKVLDQLGVGLIASPMIKIGNQIQYGFDQDVFQQIFGRLET